MSRFSHPAPLGKTRRRSGSLRTQLILGNILALSVLLGVLGVISRYTILSFLTHSVDRELERNARRGGGPPPPPPDDFLPGKDPKRDQKFPDAFHGHGEHRGSHGGGPGFGHFDPFERNPYRTHQFDLEGKSVPATDTRPIWDSASLSKSLLGETVYSTVSEEDEPIRVVSYPLIEGGRLRGTGQSAYPLKDVYRAMSGVNQALLLLIPFGLLGAGWAGAALTDRVLRRVQRMTHAAERIGTRGFSERLPVTGSDEFSELAETLNGLLSRLETSFQEQQRVLELQRRFTADASHELKTPLTIIKGNASFALGTLPSESETRQTFSEINAAADTMAQLVQDLLLLARSDEGQMARGTTELLIRELLERAAATQRGRGAPITLALTDDSLSVFGNEMELLRLFVNLMDNAVRYTPPDGRVTVTAQPVNGGVEVVVRDTGKGIAPEHLPHLGERFYRGDASRTRPTGGTGLGLSICKSIIAAHGGSLRFESELGAGTAVTVFLSQGTQEGNLK